MTSHKYLVSYRDGDNIVITKSRWFTGKYPHKKEGKNFIVSIETYAQIAQDTINSFLKGSSTKCLH